MLGLLADDQKVITLLTRSRLHEDGSDWKNALVDLDQADAILEKQPSLKPTHEVRILSRRMAAHFVLGIEHRKNGRYREALAEFENAEQAGNALQEKQTSPVSKARASRDLARVLSDQSLILSASPDPTIRNVERARELADRALALSDKTAFTIHAAAVAHGASGDYATAERLENEAITAAGTDVLKMYRTALNDFKAKRPFVFGRTAP